jgi:hypothetical protein
MGMGMGLGIVFGMGRTASPGGAMITLLSWELGWEMG